MQIPLRWLFLGGLMIAAIGLYLGYDAALAALLAPLFGVGQYKRQAKAARTAGDVHQDRSANHMNESQAYNTEADDLHAQQTQIAENTGAEETMPVDEVVDHAKKDWD